MFLLGFTMIFGMACEGMFDKDMLYPHNSQFWMVPPKFDDSGATKTLNVAAVTFDVNISSDVNRDKIVYFIEKIVSEQPNVRLILFPEMTMGYYFRPSNQPEYHKSIAETIPGNTTNVISQKAAEHQVYISFGMAEKTAEDLFISQILVGPDGAIESVYRKYYLIPADKKNGFKAGNDFIMNIIDNIKVVTIICNDINNLTVHKRIHEIGAELVLHPEATVGAVNSSGRTPAPYYQFTYTWYLGANRVGNEEGDVYDGMLYLTTPSGEPRIKETGKEGYIYGVVKCR
jgi:predicted amidohydrolase